MEYGEKFTPEEGKYAFDNLSFFIFHL
ncbi:MULTISPECIES: Ltp family lipoprotein [Bacillaceae]|nr:Ltp family lipoprotein [Bacillus infantis]MDW2879703.1 Ltp family lipoprotein [Bacillus infantis]